MRKIPSVFTRDVTDMRHVTRNTHPDCGWVLAGEGIPTRKLDGTCMMLDPYGRWWARRMVKPGKAAPAGFSLIEIDPNTNIKVGWEPVTKDWSFFAYMSEAIMYGRISQQDFEPGTYELVGPRINQNHEQWPSHCLVKHGSIVVRSVQSTTYDEIHASILALPPHWEGIVWHHPDGRMAKIKRKDFPHA